MNRYNTDACFLFGIFSFLNFCPFFSWYGDNRFTSGMGTRWTMDLSSLLLPTANLTRQEASTILVLGKNVEKAPDTFTLESPYQAVRVITVRIHIDRAQFSPDSTISVYAGDSSLSGERVAIISGKEMNRLAAMPRSSPYTQSVTYQTRYGAQIASLRDPILLEASVFNSLATISFDSRSMGGVNFVASYAFSFRCPEGLELPDPNEVVDLVDDIGGRPSCVEPKLGQAASVLILLLGIGGALVLLAFLWLMYERFQRHKAQQALLRSKSMTSDRSEAVSDEDLQSNAQALMSKLRQTAYKRVIKEFIFEVASIVWELTSTIMNWVVVGQVLANGTSNLSSLSVGYIIVVIISTFAVGANGITRIMNLSLLRKQVEAEAATSARLERMSTASRQEDQSDASELKSEAEIRKSIEDVTRRLLRLRIAALSLILHAIPFVILNLVTLYDKDDFRASSSVTVQVSIMMSFMMIGMKLQDLKDYPNQQKLLAVAELQLVQFKLAALHAHGSRRKLGTHLGTQRSGSQAIAPISPSEAVVEVEESSNCPPVPTYPPPTDGLETEMAQL